MTKNMNKRARDVLRLIIDAYLETGEPVGSRTVSEKLGMSLSPATIRNVMSELEAQGLLYAPHVSAGRLPTDAGMTVFVEGLLEFGNLSAEEMREIEKRFGEHRNQPVDNLLEQTSTLLSGLSSCAGLVVAPKNDKPLKQLEFIRLAPKRALVVLVSTDGTVENRVIDVNEDLPPSALTMAANYLNDKLAGRTLGEAYEETLADIQDKRGELDTLTAKLAEQGLASCLPDDLGGHLIVRGQARLLEDISAIEDIERVRTLFELLESRETMLRLLNATESAEGVQIFIGAENDLFDLSGCSLILSPYKNTESTVVGAVGVIGPKRLNYGRIIPILNYTSQLIGKIIS